MMPKVVCKVNSQIEYTKSNCMGGGAAVAYRAKYNGNDGYIIKVLREGSNNEKISRFESEIRELIKLKDIPGVMPIIDYDIAGIASWYLMPEAIPILTYIESKVIDIHRDSKQETEQEILSIKIKAILSLAKTLKLLHSKNIHHRDIKPQNIYFLEDHYCFGDFGLIDYPEKVGLTRTSERVGPQGYMPDEMREKTKNVDFKKSDIYELAKTLWVILTGNESVFSGKYDEDDKEIGVSNYLESQHHLVEIDTLLKISTEKIPQLRPDISKFIEYLESWLKSTTDMEYMVSKEWDYIRDRLFPSYTPATAKFTNLSDIVNILSIICRLPGINHMFLPGGGGLDLAFVEIASNEEDCITLLCNGLWLLIKPKFLLFENIEKDPLWTYFYIQTDILNKTEINEGEDGRIDEYREELTLLPTGKYEHGKVFQYRHYEDGTRIPENSRCIQRYYSSTSFVIFSKTSIYNATQSTYDGRHAHFSYHIFRVFVELMKLCFEISPSLYYKKFNKPLPFTESGKSLESYKNKPQVDIELIGKYNDFVYSLLKDCNFEKILKRVLPDPLSEAFFYITFQHSSLSFTDKNSFNVLYISVDYSVEVSNIFDIPDNALFFDTPEMAREASNLIEEFIESQCKINNISIIEKIHRDLFIQIKIVRNMQVKPTHLLTKDEIYDLLLNGDDSKNNTLVVDYKGRPFLLPEADDCSQYPVVLETFCAGNNYVGKLTDIDNRDDEYLLCLEGWLNYLSSGREQGRSDMPCFRKEDELLEEIKKYY